MKGYLIVILMIAAIIGALLALNISFRQTLQMEVAEQFNKQQLLLAKAEASNIQAYFGSVKDEMFHIAQFASLLRTYREADFLPLTNLVFRDTVSVNKRIEFLDSKGKVLFSRGKLQTESALDESGILDAKKMCPDELLIKQDTKRVYMTAPVCRADSPISAVLMVIDIQDIARAFLGPIKSGSRGYAWMMDEKGDLLYHPTQPEMVSRNLYKTDSSCFKCHKSFDVEKKIIEGKGDYFGRQVAPTGEDKIFAFSTAAVGSSRWIVAVSAPYSEVTMSIRRSLKFYSWIIILIIGVTSAVSAMLIYMNRKKEKAEQRAQHQMELERYASSLEQKVEIRTKELFEEKEKLNTIVSAIGCGIVLVDMQEKIQWVNQTMTDMAGRDITGMFCQDICADYTVVGSYVERDMQTEILSNLFGKRERYFQMTTAPVRGEDGSVCAYIRLVQDVTEMKRMEEQLTHSEKLASLERLTSGISYEIGNPLTSVFSFVQVLLDREEDEFKKETLETIFFQMNRISDILKQLSGFSKVPPVELKPCRLNNIIEDALSLIQYDKRVQDITIMKDLSSGMPDITTDRSQLSQVIVNIILNSADSVPGGGTLTIRSWLRDSRFGIVFEDTGAGMDKEHLSRIFEPFSDTKEKGKGLGLAVSYNIIKKLNGDLTVESELNRGSRFVITLPYSAS